MSTSSTTWTLTLKITLVFSALKTRVVVKASHTLTSPQQPIASCISVLGSSLLQAEAKATHLSIICLFKDSALESHLVLHHFSLFMPRSLKNWKFLSSSSPQRSRLGPSVPSSSFLFSALKQKSAIAFNVLPPHPLSIQYSCQDPPWFPCCSLVNSWPSSANLLAYLTPMSFLLETLPGFWDPILCWFLAADCSFSVSCWFFLVSLTLKCGSASRLKSRISEN